MRSDEKTNQVKNKTFKGLLTLKRGAKFQKRAEKTIWKFPIFQEKKAEKIGFNVFEKFFNVSNTSPKKNEDAKDLVNYKVIIFGVFNIVVICFIYS